VANFVEVDSVEKLDALFTKSADAPVILFKHSNSCGISAHIRYLLEEIDGDISTVTVQLNREISSEIAKRTGHRHQSPQVIVIRDGKSIHHATHYSIDPQVVRKFADPSAQ
jgi:bacillithiol system protein YtxJ